MESDFVLVLSIRSGVAKVSRCGKLVPIQVVTDGLEFHLRRIVK